MPGRYRQREDDFILQQRQHIDITIDLDHIELVVFQFIAGQNLPGAYRLQYRIKRQIPRHAFKTTLATQHQPSGHAQIEPRPAFSVEPSGKPPTHRVDPLREPIGKTVEIRHRRLAFQHPALGGEPENVSDAFPRQRHLGTAPCLART